MATIRNRTIYKTSFVQGSALLVGALCAIFSYPLWGLVVGYTFALTAVQVAGDEGAQLGMKVHKWPLNQVPLFYSPTLHCRLYWQSAR